MGKMAYTEPTVEDGDSHNCEVRLRIDGLRALDEKGMFALSGVYERDVDWAAVRHAVLGHDNPMDRDESELIERIIQLVFVHDIKMVLADRIKPV